MKRDDVIEKLRASQDLIRQDGVAHVYLFGSVARGDNKPDSDVDVLIEPYDDASFDMFKVGSTYMTVQDVLGCEIDVMVLSDALQSKRIGDDVRRDMVSVF